MQVVCIRLQSAQGNKFPWWPDHLKYSLRGNFSVVQWLANAHQQEKSALLSVTRKKHSSNFNYTINSANLSKVREHKYLGATLSQYLLWDCLIQHTTSSALKRLLFLKIQLQLAPPLRVIFNKFNWMNSPTGLLKKAGLLTIEKRAKLVLMYQLLHNHLNIDKSTTRQKRCHTFAFYKVYADALKL